jgi:HAD superfamily hydrolase (TIGR01490 family)
MMSQVAAIFDVDRTLVNGYTERLFFRHLLASGLLSGRSALAFLARLALHPGGRFQDKSYLAGLQVEGVRHLAAECFRQRILPRLSGPGLACLRKHRASGHRIILLTGSLGLLLRPLQGFAGAEWLIATELQENGGRFTGEIRGLHPRGPNKARLVTDLAQRHRLDLSRSFAYGDHLADIPLFESVGHPAVVNPCRRLSFLARERSWPVLYF